MSGSFDPSNYVLVLVAATIYLHVNQPESALKVLHASDHLECYALKIQVKYVSFNQRYLISTDKETKKKF